MQPAECAGAICKDEYFLLAICGSYCEIDCDCRGNEFKEVYRKFPETIWWEVVAPCEAIFVVKSHPLLTYVGVSGRSWVGEGNVIDIHAVSTDRIRSFVSRDEGRPVLPNWDVGGPYGRSNEVDLGDS